MGCPKALLTLPGSGETFLERLIRVFNVCCSPVIVVLGHEAERIKAGIAQPGGAVFVVNENWRMGQASSLAAGLAKVPAEASGFLFTPVDVPLVRQDTVERLIAAMARTGTAVAVPRSGGRRGHPVGCARALAAEFVALAPEGQARDVIHRHAAETCYVDVNDTGVLRDIDTPEDYRALLRTVEPQ